MDYKCGQPEDVAHVVDWAYAHDFPQLALLAVQALHTFDSVGSVLIVIVARMASHTT